MSDRRRVVITGLGAVSAYGFGEQVIWDNMIAGKTGYLIKGNEQAELTEAIRTLLNNPGLSLQMGQAGRKRLTEEFTIDKMIRAYVTLYETVAENR